MGLFNTIGFLAAITANVKFARLMSSDAALLHQSNLREQLRILFEKFGSVHSVVIYGDPSPELSENVKSSGIETVIFSFLKGLNHINE